MSDSLPESYNAGLVLQALLNRRQNKRLLRMSFPRDDGPDDAMMVVNRLDAFEAMSRDFEFKVEVLSDKPDIEQKNLVGKMVTISMVKADGTLRYFNGFIFDVCFKKNDAGFCYYDIILRPWLAFLHLRRDNFLFHDKTIEQQTSDIFSRYPECDWRATLLGQDEPMVQACQYAETDYNYVHRRWEAQGWSYHYEHRKDGHTLVLSGDSTHCTLIDGSGELAWTGKGGGVQDSGIQTFSPRRNLTSTSISATSTDFKHNRLTHLEQRIDNEQGKRRDNLGALEVYEYTGNRGVKGSADGERFIRLRSEEIKVRAKHFLASGDDERTQAGYAFTFRGDRDLLALTLGKDASDTEFLIFEVRHSARNNYETDVGTAQAAQEERAAQYSNTFRCMRKKIAWRPGRGFNSLDTKIYKLEEATVICPSGEEIETDQYGRVRVRFNWDREEGASAWLRVSSAWAGQNFGQISLPRAGETVWILWLDANPDHPVIVSRAHDVNNMPPRFNHGGSLPEDRYLSGLLSKEVKGGGFNQLRLDDTPGQVSLQILSSDGQSQVNLGHLTHPGHEGHSRPRGNGLEAATNESGAIRTAKSLLITAWARLNACGNQLSCEEHLALMQDCLNLFKTIGQYAAEHQALAIDEQPQAALKGDIEAAPAGSNLDPKGMGGKPTISITAPDGIALTSQKTVVTYSAMNIDSVAKQHLQLTSGQNFKLNAGQGISIFARKDGIRQIAHYGPFLQQSQHGDMQIDSGKNLTITADGVLTLMAEEIRLIAKDGSHIKLGGGVTLGTSGGIALKSANFTHSGPATMHAELPHFAGEGKEPPHWIALNYLDPETGEGLAGAGYEIHLDGGPALTGNLDEAGKARHENVMNKPVTKVIYKPRPVKPEDDAAALHSIVIGEEASEPQK